ncbi:MAG: DUF2264 domain-containing protein [Lachnospirales bacterium]
MIDYNLPIKNNKLETRTDMVKALKDLLRPLNNHFVYDGTRIVFDQRTSTKDDFITGIEGLSRIIWGLGSYVDNTDLEISNKVRDAIKKGTNPNHDFYFGKVSDYDQRLVEMASIGFSMAVNPNLIWNKLNSTEQNNLYNWLNQINKVKCPNCNWKFFMIMVNVGFKSVGMPYNIEKTKEYIEEVEEYYIKDGWYSDGNPKTTFIDNYIPFGMHFYGMFYAKHMKDVDPNMARKYNGRAEKFANDYIHYYVNDGNAFPYGRSLGYKFAVGSFWSMFAYCGLTCDYSLGVIKGIILSHCRYWFSKPIFNSEGILTLGYEYPNQSFPESYIAPTSTYWATKIFIILLLGAESDFWKIEEEPFPKLDETKILSIPNFVIKRNSESSMALMYNGGAHIESPYEHGERKYANFVYSTYFGFNVSRSNRFFNQCAFDNMLAVSEDGCYFRQRTKSIKTIVNETYIYSKWKPYEDVTIETYIIPSFPDHIRIHFIDSHRKLECYDTGFSIALDKGSEILDVEVDESKGLFYKTKYDYSGIIPLDNGETYKYIPTNNCNIKNSRVLTPTVKYSFEKGKNRIITYVTANKGSMDYIIPKVEITNKISIDFKNKIEIECEILQ